MKALIKEFGVMHVNGEFYAATVGNQAMTQQAVGLTRLLEIKAPILCA